MRGLNGAKISQFMYYQILCIPEKPIAIEWLNSLGGFEQHVFGVTQTFQRDVEQGLIYERAVNQDIETLSLTKGRIPLTWVESFICEAEDLTLDQLEGLMELKQSPLTRVWLTADGTKWVNAVLSNNYTTAHDSDNKRFSVRFQFELPDNFDLDKSLEYGQ
jgi:hypothetical protein